MTIDCKWLPAGQYVLMGTTERNDPIFQCQTCRKRRPFADPLEWEFVGVRDCPRCAAVTQVLTTKEPEETDGK